MKGIYFTLMAGLCLLCPHVFGQAGMTVSPGKMYYKLSPGMGATQKIRVSNPNNKELQIGASISDWSYDATGNNVTTDPGTLKTSCADWIQLMPGSYFTLQPGEQKEISVLFNVPPTANTDVPVHTAMIFFTQLNPGDSRSQSGMPIKVSVRMGVKVYHTFSQAEERSIDVLNFIDKIDPEHKDQPGYLELEVENNGKIWLESKVKWELLNTQTGEKQQLEDIDSYSLPGDKRLIRKLLPAGLKKGKYNATAIINYGNKDELKVVELEFER
ncbi:fimbrial biogenesis chaperone [Pedobacter frigoris]|uniref:Molecular chaperone n=1 Tax=Pedobacter frigoris TaxID=2571272 RepID=A0A4U1CN24_9SPHI|nr:hypothetical protein [Pedobacter frigoris]TKC08636.1 hypothetical protein FA047_00615 [Pedobacter frigoris]